MSTFIREVPIKYPYWADEINQEALGKYLKHPSDSAFWPEYELFDVWALGPIMETDASGIFEKTKCAWIVDQLVEYFGPAYTEDNPDGVWQLMTATHFAVGHVEHLNFRVFPHWYGDHSHMDRYTDVTHFLFGIFEAFNEDLCSMMDEMQDKEYEIQGIEDCGNIQCILIGMVDREVITDDYAYDLMHWLGQNDDSAMDNIDDRGCWPSKEQLLTAIDGVRIEKESEAARKALGEPML